MTAYVQTEFAKWVGGRIVACVGRGHAGEGQAVASGVLLETTATFSFETDRVSH